MVADGAIGYHAYRGDCRCGTFAWVFGPEGESHTPRNCRLE